LALLLPVLFLHGCGGDDSAGPSRDGFDGVVDEAGDYAQPMADSTATVTPLADSTATDGTIWSCTRRSVSLTEAPEELFLFNESGRVYPGALVQGGSLTKDPPDAILLRRGPGRVAINLTTGEGDSTFIDLDEMSSTTVGNAVNQLVGNRTYLPQVLTVETLNIESDEQLKVATKLTYSGFGVDAFASFKLRKDKKYSRRLVRIVQKFFDVRFERPFDAADWFHPSVTVDDFRNFAGPGNPPVYINQVTYGRVVFILIEASVSETEMEAAMKLNYDGLNNNGSVDTQTSWAGDFSDVQLKAAIYGGSDSVGLAGLFSSQSAADFNQAVAVLLSDQQVQTGLPIAYGMRDLKKDQTVKVKLATEYDVVDCTPIATALSNPIARWEAKDSAPPSTTELHPMVPRSAFKIYGSHADEFGYDIYWDGANDACFSADENNRPCENVCPGLPSNGDWDEGVIRTAARSGLIGDPLCASGWDDNTFNGGKDNWALVSSISDDVAMSPLSQLNTDKAPTLIDHAKLPGIGKVVQFHTWPDTSYTTWANLAAPGTTPLSATDGRYGILPEFSYGSMDFNGNLLVDKYFTVFLLVQSPNEIYAKNWVCSQSADCGGNECWQDCLNRFANRRGTLLLGTDRDNELRLGLTPQGSLRMFHAVGGTVKSLTASSRDANDENWHVYTVALGPTGTKLYVDGVMVAEDPTITEKLTSFQGAHVGSEPIAEPNTGAEFTSVARFKLAEFYEGAGTDLAIKAQSDSIRARFPGL
jgi:hypothetical protein